MALQFVLVAEIDGRVVGFVWCGLTDAAGEGQIKGLYVLPTLHGQGIGRELLAHAVEGLEEDTAVTSLTIGCVKENPSCGFYRHLGGVEALRRPTTVDGYQTEEIFFSWPDLSPLRHTADAAE